MKQLRTIRAVLVHPGLFGHVSAVVVALLLVGEALAAPTNSRPVPIETSTTDNKDFGGDACDLYTVLDGTHGYPSSDPGTTQPNAGWGDSGIDQNNDQEDFAIFERRDPSEDITWFLLYEMSANAGINEIGIYDYDDPSTTLLLISGPDSAHQDSHPYWNGVVSGSTTFTALRFGFYLHYADVYYYTEDDRNPGGEAHAVFYDTGSAGGTWPQTGVVIGWEDLPLGTSEDDYNDLVMYVENVTIPEPATLAFLGLGSLGLALRRRRKRSRAMAGIQKGSKPSGPRIAVLVPLVAAVLMCLTVGVRPAGAVPVTLADLLPGGTMTSIIVEDKEFYDFGGYSSVATGGASPVDPATIFVSPDLFGEEIGLQFQSASFSASSLQSQDTLFDFYVVTHGMLINDNTLRMTGAASGTGRVTVIETVRTVDDLDTLASKIVQAGAGELNLTHHMVFPYPVLAVHVSKDIGLTGGTQGFASVSHFSQTFSQIPEPATFVLMGLGVVVSLVARRRRK
ncbi:MAG: PEP-CTERM sorting domain-containing protein [Phycisphaerae bacterium]